MKRLWIVLGVTAALVLGWSIGIVQSQAAKIIVGSADTAAFKEIVKGVSKAVIWGDDTKSGGYGAFTKFVAGQDNGIHTHTNDIRIVVLKGAYIYKDDAGEKRIGPGAFLQVPGGTKHWSGGDAKEGALFYEESSGKFDLIPAK